MGKGCSSEIGGHLIRLVTNRIVQPGEKKEASAVDWRTFHGVHVMPGLGLIRLYKESGKNSHENGVICSRTTG